MMPRSAGTLAVPASYSTTITGTRAAPRAVNAAGARGRRREQRGEPQEAAGELPERGRVRADREAEQQQRGGAEHEDGDELRARAPLQQRGLAQRRHELAHARALPPGASAGLRAAP